MDCNRSAFDHEGAEEITCLDDYEIIYFSYINNNSTDREGVYWWLLST